MHTDTPSHGPALDLLLFGAATYLLIAGKVTVGLVRLAIHGTPYPGHYHGIHR